MRKGKIQGQFEILIENLEALSFVLYYINDQPPTSAIRSDSVPTLSHRNGLGHYMKS